MKGFVYILQDEKGKFYVGSTTDVKRRLKQHQHGHTQTTNRMQRPDIRLIQEYETLQDARSVEKKIKKLKRKDCVKKMILDGYIKIKPSSFNGQDRSLRSFK